MPPSHSSIVIGCLTGGGLGQKRGDGWAIKNNVFFSEYIC